jgi:lia operon protein LiaF
MRNDIWGKVIGGFTLIGIGVLFLLNQLNIMDVDIGYIASNYWPVILIFFGLKGILIQRRLDYGWGGSYLWNLIVVVIGLVFLNNNLGWFNSIGFDDIFKFLVPVILIALGLNMLLRPRRAKPGKQSEPEWTNPTESPFTPYSAQENPIPPSPSANPIDPASTGGIHNPVDPTHTSAPNWGPANTSPRPQGPFGPTEDWKKDLPQKPAILKEWITKKEEWKQHWKETHKGHHEQHHHDWNHHGTQGDVQHKHNFIGDLHVGQDYWELTPMNISHFIGDTELDLTRAVIPYGETKINISAFIGDVKVFIPNDVHLEVSVTASSFLGDINVFERREGGMFRSMQSAAPSYKDAEKRVRIVVSMFIGDVRVKRVG